MAKSQAVLDFIEVVKDGAIQTQKDYGIFASVTLAQAIIESQYGTSYCAKNDKNLFGVKIYGVHNPNLHIVQGSYATDDGGYYARYDSWSDSINDHGYFLKNNSIYTEHGVFNAKNAHEQVDCIAAAGYASDKSYATTIKSEIDYYELTQYDNGSVTDNSSQMIESAVEWAINIANDETHGYDQTYRWGEYGDYDCSSFVISAFEQAGIQLKSNGASYTGDMKEVALKIGFNEVGFNGGYDNLLRGDILLNQVHHVAIYIGNGQIVHASINENNGVTGGQHGDQTGKEICVRSFYNYPWDCVLRYKNGYDGNNKPPDIEEEVWNDIKKSNYNTNQLSAEQIKFLKTLCYGDTVGVKNSNIRQKNTFGYNFFGNRLNIFYNSYIINSVNKNGFVNIGEGLAITVNPKFLKEV